MADSHESSPALSECSDQKLTASGQRSFSPALVVSEPKRALEKYCASEYRALFPQTPL